MDMNLLSVAHTTSLRAIQGPIDVHLTGSDGSTWLDVLGPAAIVIAAIGGACLAYLLATRNLKRELAAADARQARQLKHDRQVRASEATRAVLDDVTDTLTKAIDSVGEFTAMLRTTEHFQRRGEAAPDGSAEREAYDEQRDELVKQCYSKLDAATSRTNQLRPALLRLRLRFVEDDGVYESYLNSEAGA